MVIIFARFLSNCNTPKKCFWEWRDCLLQHLSNTMTMDVITSASLNTATEVLSQIVEAILETVLAANNVLIERDGFAQLSNYLEKIVPILKELSTKRINSPDSFNNVLDILNQQVKAAKQLILDCSKRNKVYLFMTCRSIAKRIEEITKEINRALTLIPLTSLDLSSHIIQEIRNLCDIMETAQFKAALADEEILAKIEMGIQERNVDRSYANNLLLLVANAVGISTERSTLKKEFEEFKSEIESARSRKDQAEAIQMDQIIALLERADATSSPKEKEMRYFTKRNSLGSQPLEPLQTFYCPITRDVMVDPVETSSGQTFERSAIEKWFSDGNNLCPLTLTPLDTSILRPNKTLRQSIKEWRDRNTMILIASMKTKLLSEDQEEILHCLEQLQDLCEQRDLHREWVVLENYIPTFIDLLGKKNRDIRNRVLIILCILAKDSEDAKERIAKVNDAVESIVRSLGRRIVEAKLAVSLLLELSKNELMRECIGKAQGCILLLVTMSSSEDSHAAVDAQRLLENLSFSNKNIMQMAKSNYFKHLLERLSSGPDDVKKIMAATLGELELTDHSKSSLFDEGALDSLLHLVSHGDIETKEAAVKALKNLSTLPKNGLQMIREGAVPILLDLLYYHNNQSTPNLREHVAATMMNLATSTLSQDTNQMQAHVSMIESDEDIYHMFSLINLTVPIVQQGILQTFHALCLSPSAPNIKTKLMQCSAMQVLVQLCELDNPAVRSNSVKLFCCLTDGGDAGIIREHVSGKFLETLIRIIKTSNDEEEIASALGIISNLPQKEPRITPWLLDAGALPLVISFLSNKEQNGAYKNQLCENSVGALRHFTVPGNRELQKKVAEAGIITVLVQLLETGTALTKRYSAMSLTQFSMSSTELSKPIPKRGAFWCFSSPPEIGCPVHQGICMVESSFCLVEANAVGPLVRMLGESDHSSCEASLDALLTLIEGERLHTGGKVLADAKAMGPMIRLLSSDCVRLQEKALRALERIFQVVELRQKYGYSAQMPLVDITQRGNSGLKSLAARVLARLSVLHEQSSYF